MNFKIFDVIEVDLGEGYGSEQGKIRPCVICQNDIGNFHSPTLIIIPLSHVSKKDRMPTHGLIRKNTYNGLSCDSTILGEQMRVVDKSRVIKKYGYLRFQDEKSLVQNVFLANFFGNKKVKVEEAV